MIQIEKSVCIHAAKPKFILTCKKQILIYLKIARTRDRSWSAAVYSGYLSIHRWKGEKETIIEEREGGRMYKFKFYTYIYIYRDWRKKPIADRP